MRNKHLEVNGVQIGFKKINNDDYISLTDIARFYNSESPSDVIKTWMRNKDSFIFYSLWEELHNPNFNSVQMYRIKTEVGLNRFTMSPSKWQKEFNAIGIIPGAGKYSNGTYAHKDIAFEFASWIDARFKLYIITEFERLKANEQKELEWSAKRELAKINYHIHTDAIKEYLVATELTAKQTSIVYATEADVLNVALFGKTASEWRAENPDLKGNIRDYASVNQLLVIANMESYNAILIEQNIPQNERLIKLNDMAKSQLRVLQKSNSTLLLTNDNK